MPLIAPHMLSLQNLCALWFLGSSSGTLPVTQTSLPVYLPLVCLFFSSSQKPRHQSPVFLDPSTEPLPTDPCMTCWFMLHVVLNLPTSSHHLLIKPPSYLIWTKLFSLAPILHPEWSPSGLNQVTKLPALKSCMALWTQQ